MGRFHGGRDDLVLYTGVFSSDDTRVFVAQSVTLPPPFPSGVAFLPPEQWSDYLAVYHEVPMGTTFAAPRAGDRPAGTRSPLAARQPPAVQPPSTTR